jgi:hypothetical protein
LLARTPLVVNECIIAEYQIEPVFDGHLAWMSALA